LNQNLGVETLDQNVKMINCDVTKKKRLTVRNRFSHV